MSETATIKEPRDEINRGEILERFGDRVEAFVFEVTITGPTGETRTSREEILIREPRKASVTGSRQQAGRLQNVGLTSSFAGRANVDVSS